MVYIRSFLPLLPNLINCAISSTDSHHQTLVINLLRSIGIFANNASVHHLRSFSFYKDIIEIKFMTECVSLLKVYESHLNVLKLLVQDQNRRRRQKRRKWWRQREHSERHRGTYGGNR